MKKMLFVLLSAASIFSCSQKETKTEQQKAEEIVNEASSTEIANQLAGLNMDVAQIRNELLTKEQRQRYMDHMKENYIGFLAMATLDNINSQEFEEALNRQKELITTKVKAVYAEALYKLRLKQQLDAENDLKRDK